MKPLSACQHVSSWGFPNHSWSLPFPLKRTMIMTQKPRISPLKKLVKLLEIFLKIFAYFAENHYLCKVKRDQSGA